jgi:hypothetical protein
MQELYKIDNKVKVIKKFDLSMHDDKVKTQGITMLNENFVFSGGIGFQGIQITNANFSNLVFKTNSHKNFKPPVKQIDHIGSCDDYKNCIYSPWEDSKGYNYPIISEHDTYLNLLRYGLLDKQYLIDGAAWCSVSDGYLYISQYEKPQDIFVFKLSRIMTSTTQRHKPDKILPLILPRHNQPKNIQCGKIFEGKLYILDDYLPKTKKIYEINLSTGICKLIFHWTSKYGGIRAESFYIYQNDTSIRLFLLSKEISKKKHISTIRIFDII